MRVVEVPAIMKPRSLISSWAIPMVYDIQQQREIICDNCDVRVIIKSETTAYTNAVIMTMQTDALGRPVSEKIAVDVGSAVTIDLPSFIKMAAPNINSTIRGTFDVYKDYAVLVRKVFDALDADLRAVIAKPVQWLVYDIKANILTRLSYVRKLYEEIEVRPFGKRNILLAARRTDLEKLNKLSVTELKKARLAKERLNQLWASLVARQKLEEIENALAELASESEATQEQAGESEETKHVEVEV